MRLGDTHILIRIVATGAFHVSVTYGVIDGAEIEVRTWESTYRFEKHSDDPQQDLARLLGLVSHDIPQ